MTMEHSKTDVEVRELSMRYGGVVALDRVDFNVSKGELVSLLGPSGCGKTTLLRSIAGLLHPSEGSIRIGRREVLGVPAHQRNVGFVFQNYALFPHMSVRQNVAFGLRMRRQPRAQIDTAVEETLSTVQLLHLADRMPGQLSGGQQQRVALARSIVLRPTILLLDEPFAALDRALRDRMQMELRALQRRIGITTIFVTHDQDEALRISDRIAVMQSGRIQQIDTPRALYGMPNSPFVLGFIGQSNILNVTVAKQAGDILEIACGQQMLCAPRRDASFTAGTALIAAIRPERMTIELSEPGSDRNFLKARISDVIFLGDRAEFHLVVDGLENSIVVHRQADAQTAQLWSAGEGRDVWVSWGYEETMLFHPGEVRP